MSKITPFLWFDTQAEEAAHHYVEVFSGAGRESKITGVSRYGDAGPGEPGSVMTVSFVLDGLEFTALNGGPHFTFNESVSFVVSCANQEEIDTFWEAFTKEGQASQCGWLKDRYGLSWQIVPSELGALLGGPDPAKSQRATQAMLKMRKLVIEDLRNA